MNKVTKTAIAGLLALFAGNAAATDGEIVFDGEILKSACEINDSDKKIEVALGHYNAEQFRNIGERSPKIPFTIPLVKEGANKQVISSQADSLIKISRIWA
ncbi:fimbrial protein, partial [Escherichia coli]